MKTEPTRPAEITISISGEPVKLKVDIPLGPTRPSRMLPLFRTVCHSIVDAAVARAASYGKEVTCSAGCGACCRQLVPISLVEAGHLRSLVASLPDEKKAEVLARFEEAKLRLEEADLLRVLEQKEKPAGASYKELGMAYFRLGIPCPFLVDESCSIHKDRPLVCREYLVVSPPENCARQNSQPVEVIRIPGEPSKALAALSGGEGQWTPLILALEASEPPPDREAARSGEKILKDFFRQVLS